MAYTLRESGEIILIHADGDNEKEAFQDGGRALFEIMAKDMEKLRGDERVKIVVDAPSLGALFGAWITELASHSKDNNILFLECSIATIQKVSNKEYLLTGAAYGELFDESRHKKNHIIKDVSKPSCERDTTSGLTVCRCTVAFST